MRVILDECVDRRFAAAVAGHDVTTVPREGWAGIANGELLRRVAESFDVFVTIDKNLPDQQNLSGVDLAVVVLDAVSNRLADLLPLAPGVLDVLADIRPGEIRVVRGP